MTTPNYSNKLVDKSFTGRKADWPEWSVIFLDAADGKGDEEHSWKDCFEGTDRQVGLNQTQTRRRNVRRRESLSALLKCIDDTTTRDAVRAAANVTARTKHFERWISYARDLYQRHVIGISHLPTDVMPADIFTKALPLDAFVRHRAKLMNCG